MSKRLPEGLWKDTQLNDHPLKVIYYDSRSRCYRIEYLDMMGMRVWAPVEEFGPGKKFQSMGAWGLILQQKRARNAPPDRRPRVLSAADFTL